SHLLRALRPGLLDRGANDLLELVVAELLRQVGLDHIGLGALGARLLVAAAASVGLRGLEPLLALALQHRDLVAVAELRVLLERVRDQAQRRNAIALAGAHRGLRVLLNPLEDRHARKGSRRPGLIRCAPARRGRAASAGTGCRARGTTRRRPCTGSCNRPRRRFATPSPPTRGSAAPSRRPRA